MNLVDWIVIVFIAWILFSCHPLENELDEISAKLDLISNQEAE